jgi:transcriptional regulator with XRE-family HTH domain
MQAVPPYTLKLLRNLHQYTIQDIANRVGSSYGTVQQLESGKRTLTLIMLEKILPVYDMEYEEFFRLGRVVRTKTTKELIGKLLQKEA